MRTIVKFAIAARGEPVIVSRCVSYPDSPSLSLSLFLPLSPSVSLLAMTRTANTVSPRLSRLTFDRARSLYASGALIDRLASLINQMSLTWKTA